MSDITDLLKKNVEQKKQPKGYNSFIAAETFYEFQIDLLIQQIRNLRLEWFVLIFLVSMP